jgi:tRNA A-37 threonylcarbamoyl transferase component Bud32
VNGKTIEARLSSHFEQMPEWRQLAHRYGPDAIGAILGLVLSLAVARLVSGKKEKILVEEVGEISGEVPEKEKTPLPPSDSGSLVLPIEEDRSQAAPIPPISSAVNLPADLVQAVSDGAFIFGRTHESNPHIYVPVKKADEGGMGEITLARQYRTGQKVAVKEILKQLAGDPKMLERFQREAEAIRRIGNEGFEGVVRYINHSRDYLVMEWLDGKNLNIFLEGLKNDPAGLKAKSNILKGLARTLDYVWRKERIFHRDLKPGNIMMVRVNKGGKWVWISKIIDWGICRFELDYRTFEETSPKGPELEEAAEKDLTKAGSFMGSPNYTAPEMFRKEPVDNRLDVYSLGVMVYRMFAGRLPIEGGWNALVAAHLAAEPPTIVDLHQHDLAIPPRLSSLVLRMLSRSRDLRPGYPEIIREIEVIKGEIRG